MRNKIIIISTGIIGLILGLFIGNINTKHHQTLSSEESKILKQLLFSTNENMKNNECLIYDLQGKIIQKLTVSDYIGSYISFSFKNLDNTIEDFECGSHGEDICSFSFGLKGKEAYTRILTFEYNSSIEKINKDSFSCMAI